MRRGKVTVLIALMLPLCMALGGCSTTLQPENQNYGLSMSIDRTDEGLIELGLLVPSGKESDGGGEDEPQGKDNYQRFFTLGASYTDALDIMQASTPRTLNLTQLKSIVISQRLASEPAFKGLVESLTLTNHLYGSTYVIICLTSAKDFLNAEKPQAGKRLVSELYTSLKHYEQQGYLPLCRLSDLYYGINSIYGDPVVSLGAPVDTSQDVLTLPSGDLGDALPGALPRLGLEQNELMGGALIRDGQMIGVLDGAECRWLQVLNGRLSGFNYVCQGLTLRLECKSRPRVSVDLSKNPIVIDISLQMIPAPLREMPDAEVLKQQLKTELMDLLAHCQSLSVDPFDFAEIAAAQFLTVEDFVRYGWREHWRDAEIRLSVEVVGTQD